MEEEIKEMQARLKKLERKVASQDALINKLYTLDIIQNYTKYRSTK